MTNIDHLRDTTPDLESSTTVLTEYCRQRVVAWNVACNDPEHPAQLTHYVEPHYSWLRDSATKVLDSSRRSTTATEEGDRLADEFEPVAAPGDDANTELAKLIAGSRLICMSADAGAGKTVFTRRLEAFVSSTWARNKLFAGQPLFAARFEAWPEGYDDRLFKALGIVLHSNCRQFGSLTPRDVARWALEVDHGRCQIARELMGGFVRYPPRELEEAGHAAAGGVELVEHSRVVRPFEIMTTAVTRRQFALFDSVREGQLSQEPVLDSEGPGCPVVGVTWFDAFAFSKWLGPEYRLPTEVEWEFAIREGSLRQFQGDFREWCWDQHDEVPVPAGGHNVPANRGELMGFRVVRAL